MMYLLNIDVEAYFQIVSILFYKGKVFNFIRQQKLGTPKAIKQQFDMFDDPSLPKLSHLQILERFDQVCHSKLDKDSEMSDDIKI